MTDGSLPMDHDFIERHSILQRYLAGKLDAAELEGFEIHVLDCSMCTARLRADDALATGFKAASAEGLIASATPRRAGPRWVVPYAMAASVLLVIAVGMLFWRDAGPPRTLTTQVIPLLAQRDAGGTPPLDVRIGAGPELLVLVVDGVQPELAHYELSIADAAGVVLFEAHDLAPQFTLNADRLVVSVPSSSLKTGDLQVSVMGRRSDGSLTRSARFALHVTTR